MTRVSIGSQYGSSVSVRSVDKPEEFAAKIEGNTFEEGRSGIGLTKYLTHEEARQLGEALLEAAEE